MSESQGTTPAPEGATPGCGERTWCAADPDSTDHDDFHHSHPVDLVPSHAEDDDLAEVSAWLVEPRDGGRGVQLVIDGRGRFAGKPPGCELDARDAALLLKVTVVGCDARERLLELLSAVQEIRADLGGAQ